jgi:hypothetical protein
MTEIQSRKKFISFLSNTFDITQNEASYLSWKTGIEKDFTDFTFISSDVSFNNYDQTVKFMQQKSSKFQTFLDELQNRKETEKSFKKT